MLGLGMAPDHFVRRDLPAIRRTPSMSLRILKFMSSPRGWPDELKYEIICAECNWASCSIALIKINQNLSSDQEIDSPLANWSTLVEHNKLYLSRERN